LFEPQKRFDGCRGVRNRLPFDFYLPAQNLVIEYQGRQHFEDSSWGGEAGLAERQRLDTIKREYCTNNGIKLLEIRYDENVLQKLRRTIDSSLSTK
jgi:very-short-patch-repair endonuclease